MLLLTQEGDTKGRISLDKAALTDRNVAAKTGTRETSYLANRHESAFKGKLRRGLIWVKHGPSNPTGIRCASDGAPTFEMAQAPVGRTKGNHLGGINNLHSFLKGLAYFIRVSRNLRGRKS